MKKFLFTLVALLAAGSICAQDYVFIEDTDLKGQTGEVELYIQGHFEYAPSAFQINFGQWPEGITVLDTEVGADSQISYRNSTGRAKTSSPLYVFENGNLMCAQAETEYYQVDGAWVSAGPVNWAPGDYEELGIIYVEVTEDFKGGDIEYTSFVDYGPENDMDPRQDEFPWHNGTITMDRSTSLGEVAAQVADKPVITFTPSAGGVSIDIEPYTEFTITVNGVEVEVPALPFFVEAEYDVTKVINVSATNAPQGYNPASETGEYTLQPKQKEQNSTPSVTYSYENGELTVWAYGCTEDDVTYTLYCDGVEYTGTFPIAVDATEGYNHTWTATAVSPTTTVSEVSAPCEIVIEAVLPEYQTPKPTIASEEDDVNQVVIITIQGEGIVTARVDGVNYTDEDGDGTIVVEVPYGETENMINVYASATAIKPGYDVIPNDNTATVYIPAKPVTPQTAKPNIDVVTNEDGTVTVTVTGEGTLNVTIEGYDLELDVITYTGESPYTITLQQAEEAQEVTVSATAQAAGELESDPAVKTFEIEALTPPTPQLLTGEIQFGEVNQENGQFTVTYTGNEANVTITLNDETILPVRATEKTFVLPDYGEYDVVATATAPGYDNQVTGEAHLVWTKPDVPVVAPTAPQITIDTEAGAIIVGATEQEGATTTLYQVDDVTGANPVEIENPTAFPRTDTQYSVWVYATAINEAGEATSTITEVIIPAAEETGINEMMGGKTISNVRYFNMAGQEMQEANGMTIVVTTYTDGTQTAVKVMK